MARKKKNDAGGIRDKISSTFESAKEKVGDARERADEFVADNPMKSIAIAASVGAIVAIGVTALIMHPRRKSFLDRLFDLF